MLLLGSQTIAVEAPGAMQAEPPADSFVLVTTAELAECNCPEFCERDHDVD